MEEGLTFNMSHYMNVYRARSKPDLYCFPLRMFLGENGLYENHELKGKTFRRKFTGERFTVDNVYVHWFNGFYFVALARNAGNSHTSITWDINTNGALGEFTLNYYSLQE